VLIIGLTETLAMARCTWITEDGTQCKRKATHGNRCGYRNHWGPQKNTSGRRKSTGTRTAGSARGSYGSARPKSAPTSPSSQASSRRLTTTTSRLQAPEPAPPSRREQERKRVEKAAELCADLISNGWQETATDQIVAYAPTTWIRLRRSSRRQTCKALARLARSVLTAKTLIHKGVGKLTGWLADKLGAGDATRAFAEELASNIPLPTDAKMVAVARGLQVAGIVLCLMDGKNLERCDCFVALVRTETEERVKQILIAGMSNWADLARFPSRDN
jgi:hypothetical protein